MIYGQRFRFLLKEKLLLSKKKICVKKRGRGPMADACKKKRKKGKRSKEKRLTSGSGSSRKMGRAADESSLYLD